MAAKNTDELKNTLKDVHMKDVPAFFRENRESLLTEEKPFAAYMRRLIRQKGLKQRNVFIMADVSEGHAYKLLSQEKHTKQRDVILRICYAAEFTLEETQKALRIYGMPELYPKYPRDAALMICFNERPGSVIDVNEFLETHGFEVLRPCGALD